MNGVKAGRSVPPPLEGGKRSFAMRSPGWQVSMNFVAILPDYSDFSGAGLRDRVNREVVPDDDQTPPGPASARCLEQFEQLAPAGRGRTRSTTRPGRHVEAREDSQGAVTAMDSFEALRGDKRPAAGMPPLENLGLHLLVNTEHPACRGEAEGTTGSTPPRWLRGATASSQRCSCPMRFCRL